MTETAGHKTRGWTLTALAALATALFLDLLYYPDTLEDAYITFRYSQHLADGYGFGAWNTAGERVEGYSTFLWMLWLAAAPFLGLEIATLAKWTGIASHLGLVALFFALPGARRRDLAPADTPLAHPDAFRMAGLTLALYLPVAWYATSGMETIAFALLVGLCLLLPLVTERAAVLALVAVALTLMRPEGVAFAIGCNALHLLLRRADGLSLRPAGVGVAAALAAAIALTAFRLQVYGDPLPNTFYAKVGGSTDLHVRLGARYLEGWFDHHPAWAALLVWIGAVAVRLALRRGFTASLSLLFVAAVPLAFSLYILRVGGDNLAAFPYWRHVLHVLPILALALAAGVISLTLRRRVLCFALFALLLAYADLRALQAHGGTLLRATNAALAGFPDLSHREHPGLDLWLARIAERDTVIASAGAGEMPFAIDAVHIDVLGLNDREIATHGSFDPAGPIDSKTDMRRVLARQPDIIKASLSGRKIAAGVPRSQILKRRQKMALEMLGDPSFKSEYLFVVNAPYEHGDTAVFLRRSFFEAHPRRDELECVPVTQTTLYTSGSR